MEPPDVYVMEGLNSTIVFWSKTISTSFSKRINATIHIAEHTENIVLKNSIHLYPLILSAIETIQFFLRHMAGLDGFQQSY